MEDFKPRVQQVETPEEREPSNVDVVSENLDSGGNLLLGYEVADFFGANANDYHEMDKVNIITKEVMSMGLDGTDAIIFMQNIQNRLAPPPIGVSRLDHFWNYFKLMKATNDLNKRKRAYEQ